MFSWRAAGKARPLVWSGKTNSLFLGGIAARKAHPLLESGNIDSLFLGGSTAGQRAHSYGVGKMIDLSCDKFMSICGLWPLDIWPDGHSICGPSCRSICAASRHVVDRPHNRELFIFVLIVFSSRSLSSHRAFDLVTPTPGVYRRWTQSEIYGE